MTDILYVCNSHKKYLQKKDVTDEKYNLNDTLWQKSGFYEYIFALNFGYRLPHPIDDDESILQ
ncbi:hypothetical protein [Capnocytophaga canimorsus]|uniref:hypothetical protein n=1 Tax=Capnocytophaga canimorsus TaxID=28188 RepID=UPI0037D8CB3E